MQVSFCLSNIDTSMLMSILDEIILLVLVFVALLCCHKRYQSNMAKKTKSDACAPCMSYQQGPRSTQRKKRCLDDASPSSYASDAFARVSDSSEACLSLQVPHAQKIQSDSTCNLRRCAGMERYGSSKMPALKDMGPQLERVLKKLSPDDAAVLKACLDSKDKRIGGTCSPSSPIPEKRSFQIQVSSLRDNLQRLATFESSRVIMVKKINKLGFNSNRVLQHFFSKFGKVEEVLMTHGIDKRTNPDRPKYRPAAVGFMVVESSEVAAAILQSPEYNILGIDVTVGRFENMSPKDTTTEHSDVKKGDESEDDIEST
mmetsp:Transcript_82522/g.129748  ORF Transcript_82522/g.129748 Transcript_82522/m.129748 type:complete len:315 (-) Transcript_82522:176-1120(-)